MIRSTVAVAVPDASAVSVARRSAGESAQALRLSESSAAKAALVATELATNLVKHGGGGVMLFAPDQNDAQTLTIAALDKGSGIASVPAALEDGYSTAGSPGTGLGAVVRAASSYEIYAQPEQGTAILCRIGDASPRTPAVGAPQLLNIAGISVAKPGETSCGDAWIALAGCEHATIGIADGLGHGSAAESAALGVIRSMQERPGDELERMLQDAHDAIRSTRGAAVGVGRIHAAAGRLDFAGVGNIAAVIFGDQGPARRTVSLPGIVGHEMRKVQVFSYPWTTTSVLVMHSDGIGTGVNLDAYPGLARHESAMIAAVLYRDFCRGTDDATIVVAKAS